MKYKFLRMSLLCAFAFLFGGVALGALMANEGTKLIDFPSTDTGITANGTTTKGTVSELTVFTLKNGYTGNNAGNNISLTFEGGFKKGDVITVAGFVDKAEKRATVVLFSAPATNSTEINKIKTFEDFVNFADNKTAADITEQSYTLESDYDALYLGRDGGTNCNVSIIKVVRPSATGDEGGGGEPTSTFRDIKLNLIEHSEVLTGNPVYITVTEEGNIGTTQNADEAAATVQGSVHGSYGSSNFTADVPVEGCVKITYATHDYGNDIVVTNDAGEEVAKFNTQGAKWMSDPNNVVVAYYRNNTPTTLHFSKANYNPYFAVEAIDEKDLPAETTKYNVTFAAGEGVEGTVPAALEIESGNKFTAPINYTLYKEGCTLIGWESGNAVYLPGQEVAPEADMTLTAKFAENEVNLADRTDAVTINYNLSGYNDYPKYKFEGSKGFIVTQATVNGKSIDVKADVDATSGKFAHNGSGWHQVNTGTKVTVPSCKDATFAVATYNSAASVNFNGAAGTEDANTAIYTATANDATLEISQVSNNYWNALTITLPVTSQGGDEPAAQDITATWDFVHNCANLAPKSEGGAYTAETMASDVEGISMKIIYNGGVIKNNDNSYQVGNGVEMQIPVKNAGDLVVVKGYYGYSYYKINNGDEITNTSENPQTEYKAKASDAERGYVAVTSTNNNNYYLSISVTQYAPKEATTLDNEEVGATFPFNQGTAGQKANFTDNDAEYFLSSKVALGSNNSYKGTVAVNGVTMTLIEPTDKLVEAGETGTIRFLIQPKFGFTFTPTKVALKASKVGTDNGTIDVAWQNTDATTVSLAKGIAPERNNKNGYSALEYSDLSAATPGEGACGIVVTLYGLQTAKQMGFADIVIEGTLNGTEKEVPVLASFKINGKEYAVEDVFEDQYEADLKLSKKEAMISSSNPLTDITPASGEIGTVTYEGTETSCKVTIPMIGGEVSLNYILNITQKPDYTLTYFDTDGTALPNKQTVEEDSKIGEFIYDIADISARQNGYKARGWFKQNYVGAKHSVNDVVTSDLNLYAIETEIEVASLSKKYEFDLTDINFDAVDHEAFNPTGGTPNVSDMRHGWNFKEGNTIDLLVGPKASIIITTCQYPTGGTTKIAASNGQEVAAVSENDGATQAIEYEGEAGTLTLTITGGQCYIHKIVILNTAETNYDQKGQWIYVKQGDASSFLDAIDAANGMSGTDRIYVYVPNGTYDLGQTTLTTIGRNNISIIGESMEGTIIKNRPIKEGIAITATLLNTASNTYLQDLTLDCIAPYGTGDDTKSAERGVCLQDKGTKTVCKNVYLKGLQDTYYSNGAEGMTAYFENCKIEGTVDFICGNGSVLFNECDLYVADRTQSKTSANVITAPATYASEKGYAFYGCTIDGTDNQKDKYNLGRPWQKSPAATYVNTTMKINASSAGWTSMNKADAIRFHEFNTKNAEGSEVKTHNVNACETSGTKDELYLTEEQAANYAPEKFFTSWTPETVAKQVDAPTDAKLENGTITWTAVSGAAGYAIFANDELLAIVGADVTSYVIENAGASRRAGSDAPVYTIRAVNAMGGFGEAKIISDATGISQIKAEEKIDWDNQVVYDLNGRRVKQTSKGVFIINGNKVIIK
ncbi:MAG: hypothetical protein IJ888_02775 [Prevotella sp.]|nr:hypothetical protein [Prevotella sp.]